MNEIVKYVEDSMKYITEYGLGNRMRYAVDGANTVEDLSEYLATDPHPEYRLVSCQMMSNCNWHLVWELLDT